MSIVKGDRIAESRKLNRCGRRAFEAYGYYVSVLHDDFGRFRFSPRHAGVKLYPRRADVLERDVRQLLGEYQAQDLLRVWEQDGVLWAEWTDYVISGRRYHTTPEPPWSDHVHTRRCERTGARMERLWGARVSPLSRGDSEKVPQGSTTGPEGVHQGSITGPEGVHQRSTTPDLVVSTTSKETRHEYEHQTAPSPAIPSVPSPPSVPSSPNGTENGLTEPGPATPPRPGVREPVQAELPEVIPRKRPPKYGYLTPYGGLWEQRWGAESEPPWGELAAAFASPRARDLRLRDPPEFKARFWRWLAAAKTSQLARPIRFVQGLGEWAAAGPQPPARASPAVVWLEDHETSPARLVDELAEWFRTNRRTDETAGQARCRWYEQASLPPDVQAMVTMTGRQRGVWT